MQLHQRSDSLRSNAIARRRELRKSLRSSAHSGACTTPNRPGARNFFQAPFRCPTCRRRHAPTLAVATRRKQSFESRKKNTLVVPRFFLIGIVDAESGGNQSLLKPVPT
jgi:hypothetical protein